MNTLEDIEIEELERLSKIENRTFLQEREFLYLKEEYLKEIKKSLDTIES